MNLLSKIVIIFKTLVYLIGYIPACINLFLYAYPIVTFIIFALFIYLVARNYSSKATTLLILTLLFSYLSFLSFNSSPGTSGNLDGLSKVSTSIFYAALFIIISLINLVILLITIYKERKEDTEIDIINTTINNQEENSESKKIRTKF